MASGYVYGMNTADERMDMEFSESLPQMFTNQQKDFKIEEIDEEEEWYYNDDGFETGPSRSPSPTSSAEIGIRDSSQESGFSTSSQGLSNGNYNFIEERRNSEMELPKLELKSYHNRNSKMNANGNGISDLAVIGRSVPTVFRNRENNSVSFSSGTYGVNKRIIVIQPTNNTKSISAKALQEITDILQKSDCLNSQEAVVQLHGKNAVITSPVKTNIMHKTHQKQKEKNNFRPYASLVNEFLISKPKQQSRSKMQGVGSMDHQKYLDARTNCQDNAFGRTPLPLNVISMPNSTSLGAEDMEVEPSSPIVCHAIVQKDDVHNDGNKETLNKSLTNMQWLRSIKMDSLVHSPRQVSDSHPTEEEIKKISERCGTLQRPPYSYYDLIQMAIRSTEEKRMTLKEIYMWIEEHFPYYKHRVNKGWKNSIRHNLSLYQIFVREQGQGKHLSYWTVRNELAKPRRATTPIILPRTQTFQHTQRSEPHIRMYSNGGQCLNGNGKTITLPVPPNMASSSQLSNQCSNSRQLKDRYLLDRGSKNGSQGISNTFPKISTSPLITGSSSQDLQHLRLNSDPFLSTVIQSNSEYVDFTAPYAKTKVEVNDFTAEQDGMLMEGMSSDINSENPFESEFPFLNNAIETGQSLKGASPYTVVKPDAVLRVVNHRDEEPMHGEMMALDSGESGFGDISNGGGTRKRQRCRKQVLETRRSTQVQKAQQAVAGSTPPNKKSFLSAFWSTTEDAPSENLTSSSVTDMESFDLLRGSSDISSDFEDFFPHSPSCITGENIPGFCSTPKDKTREHLPHDFFNDCFLG